MSATRTVLIIYPHWPPSNLVGVHRVRLIANALPDHGWTPLILTVHEKHYESSLSPELTTLVREGIEVIKVAADPVRTFGIRTIGDLGLRAFTQLKANARALCKNRQIDFIWFSIPSWYPPLMGAALTQEFSIPFGIDYQDPWVHPLPKDTPRLSRAWITQRAARLLEPIALKSCKLITGINPAYFQGTLDRNPSLHCHTAAFQLGFDPNDHNREIEVNPPWSSDAKYLLYPGAFLPLSAPFYEALFSACRPIVEQGRWPGNTILAFIGTSRPDRPISAIAERHGVKDIVFESAERIPFLEVQQLLRGAEASLVIGSPEAHYSASKVFQCLLSGRPVVAALHQESEAATILNHCNAGSYLALFNPNNPGTFEDRLRRALTALFDGASHHWNPNLEALSPYHAAEGAKVLAEAMETVLQS